jgi:hypothetical protein
MDGKALAIEMSLGTCVDPYSALIKLRAGSAAAPQLSLGPHSAARERR